MEYIFSLLALWPSGEHVLIQHITNTLANCNRIALWYSTTLRADGVDSIAWTCVRQLAV